MDSALAKFGLTVFPGDPWNERPDPEYLMQGFSRE